jgi:hypothetical protein
MYDMFIGGVSLAGESSADTLLREISEEIGIDLCEVFNADENLSTSFEKRRRVKEIQRVHRNNRIMKGRQGDKPKQSLNDEEALSGNDMTDVQSSLKSDGNTDTDTYTDIGISTGSPPGSGSGCKIAFLGKTIVKTDMNQCLVDIYSVILSDRHESQLTFKDGEIQWGKWMTIDELITSIEAQRDMYVPDGLQVWDSLPEMLKDNIVTLR